MENIDKKIELKYLSMNSKIMKIKIKYKDKSKREMESFIIREKVTKNH